MVDFQNVSIHFTGENLFENVNFRINKDDRFCLVGSNGSGKTTLLNIIAGKYSPSEGKVIIPKNYSIGFLPQEFFNNTSSSVFNDVKSSMKNIVMIEEREKKIQKILSSNPNESDEHEAMLELDKIHEMKESYDYYAHESQIEKVLFGMGFSENEFYKKVNEFSGGWQMRIELCKILLADHDLLMMDEPTNHLDIDTLDWLINYLKNYNGSLLLVSHDRYFLNQLTNKTIEIFNHNLTVFNGNYSRYLELKVLRDEQLLAQQKSQDRLIKQTEKFIERFRYKATKSRQVQSRIKQLDKIEKIELPDFEKQINLRFPDPPQSGSIALEISDISKSYGDNRVFSNLSLQLERKDKIALVGPNGAGKSTLAKIIANVIKPDSGEVKLGYNALISYYSQEVANALDSEKDIFDTIYESNSDLTPGYVRSLLGSFLFSDDDVFKNISVLSGGEKSRVALAKLMVKKSNLIILDEPTNHLDYNSKAVLQKALEKFNGTLIIVAHDIDFLRPVVNKVLELRGHSSKLFYGGIDYYLEKRDFSEIQHEIQKSNKDNSSKKDIKRIEAELRQGKYRRTKDIRKNLDKIEQLISALENEKVKIEHELALPEVFSNPNLAKEKNLKYSEIKNQLEKYFEQWTQLSEELENIEKQFSV